MCCASTTTTERTDSQVKVIKRAGHADSGITAAAGLYPSWVCAQTNGHVRWAPRNRRLTARQEITGDQRDEALFHSKCVWCLSPGLSLGGWTLSLDALIARTWAETAIDVEKTRGSKLLGLVWLRSISVLKGENLKKIEHTLGFNALCVHDPSHPWRRSGETAAEAGSSCLYPRRCLFTSLYGTRRPSVREVTSRPAQLQAHARNHIFLKKKKEYPEEFNALVNVLRRAPTQGEGRELETDWAVRDNDKPIVRTGWEQFSVETEGLGEPVKGERKNSDVDSPSLPVYSGST